MEDTLNDKIIAWAKGRIWPGVELFPKCAGRGRRRVRYLDSEFNTLSIQTCSDVTCMSGCICIIWCLERIHICIYIVYIARSEQVVSIFLGRTELVQLSRNICDCIQIFFPNPNAQQMFSHHSLGSIAVYLSHGGACASHRGGPVQCPTSCHIRGPRLPVHRSPCLHGAREN